VALLSGAVIPPTGPTSAPVVSSTVSGAALAARAVATAVTAPAQPAGSVSGCAVTAGVHQTFVLGTADRLPTGAIPFDSLYSEIGAYVPAVRVGPADVAFLPWSSGTSGLPKNVVLTHRNLVASLCQMQPVHAVGEDDIVIAALRLFHAFGFQITLNLALLQGATVVILPRFELDAFLAAVQSHAVTRAEVVPPISWPLPPATASTTSTSQAFA
jgi:acyl-CoA synthetase (AMP-forming)/AMP-acid ligase II